MPTFTDDYAAIRAVKTRLETLFDAGGDYGADYQTVQGVDIGGVSVVMRNDKNSSPETPGLLVLLDQEDGEDDEEWSSATDQWRIVTLGLNAQASDFTGAQLGSGMTATTQERLSRDLVSEFKSNHSAWTGLGLYDVSLKSNRPTAEEDGTVQVIPHRLRFRYQVT